MPLKSLHLTLLLALQATFLPAAEPPSPPTNTSLSDPTTLIVQTPFDQPGVLAAKPKPGPASKLPGQSWQPIIGQWTVKDGALHGNELEADHHHASCIYKAEFTDVIITAKFKLGGATEIAFGCRDAIAPNNHLSRVYITPTKLWIQKMSGISKTTKSQKLKEMPATFDPETWYDITLEISGDHIRAKIGDQVIEAHHERFKDAKGLVALVAKSEGAQFKDVAVWNAKPKG